MRTVTTTMIMMSKMMLNGENIVWVVDMVSVRYPPFIRKLLGVFTSKGAEAVIPACQVQPRPK